MSAHFHCCRYGPSTEPAQCPGECACVCGAVLVHLGYSRWAWQLPDGSRAEFPDPNEEAGTIDRAPIEEEPCPVPITMPKPPRVRMAPHCTYCKQADGDLTTTKSGHVHHKECAAKYAREWAARNRPPKSQSEKRPPGRKAGPLHCEYCKQVDSPDALSVTPSGRVYHKRCATEYQARRKSA